MEKATNSETVAMTPEVFMKAIRAFRAQFDCNPPDAVYLWCEDYLDLLKAWNEQKLFIDHTPEFKFKLYGVVIYDDIDLDPGHMIAYITTPTTYRGRGTVYRFHRIPATNEWIQEAA